MDITVDRVKKLFRVDNPGRHALLDGTFPKWMEREPNWEDHLSGDMALCITPLGYNNTCYFGALDIDAKGDAPPVNHARLQYFIEEHDLPLNLYYSKSGKGAHAYIFSLFPVAAADMRATLRLFSVLISHLIDPANEIEIFPKQDVLNPGEDGNCIRPPYFGKQCQPLCENEPTVRQLVSLPGCLSALPEEGERNNFMYHMTNFLVLCEIKNIKKLMHILNVNLDSPLTEIEVDRTVASAQRQRGRKGAGFGLGCSHCPENRKEKCRFSAQLRVAETYDVVKIEIVHYIAEDPKIRMTVDNKSLVFDVEDVFNNHKIRLDFIMKHRITDVPLMKKSEWTQMVHQMLETAEHVDIVTHRDKGHFIIQQLKKWAKDFKPGVSYLYSGTPVFLSDDEVMMFSHDVYNRLIATGVQGITREDINITLESIGKLSIIDGSPAIKIPVQMLGVTTPGLEVQVINDMDPKDVIVDNDSEGKVIFKDQNGARIELTNTFIKEHPEIQKKILEKTRTGINVTF
jgi:hypothetical protein